MRFVCRNYFLQRVGDEPLVFPAGIPSAPCSLADVLPPPLKEDAEEEGEGAPAAVKEEEGEEGSAVPADVSRAGGEEGPSTSAALVAVSGAQQGEGRDGGGQGPEPAGGGEGRVLQGTSCESRHEEGCGEGLFLASEEGEVEDNGAEGEDDQLMLEAGAEA